MGIIGVVAALTLPNLNSSTGDKEKVVKLQKLYSNLQDALGRAEAVYGPVDEWFVNDNDDNKKTKRVFERMTEFMKYSKICTVSDACTYKFDSGSSSGINVNNGIILADGSAISFAYDHTTASYIGDDGFGGFDHIAIFIDLDGFTKGPNKHGRDFFVLFLNHNRGVHAEPHNENQKYVDDYSLRSAAWIIENGNMDYLKCNDLQFGVKTSCK